MGVSTAALASGRATVLLVGHGSRDPRSAATLRDLRERVARGTSARVELAFLELSEPRLEDVAAGLTGEVVVVPLLLASAFHARFDLPGRLAAIEARRGDLRFARADVLGPSPLLDAAVAARVLSVISPGGEEARGRGLEGTESRSRVSPRGETVLVAGGDAIPGAASASPGGEAPASPRGETRDGVILLGAGSSHARANAEVDGVAERVAASLGVPVVAGFVTRGRSIEEAAVLLRAAGASRLGAVPWFLAPGLLLDQGEARARGLGVHAIAPPLADDPRLARLVLDRAAAGRAVAVAA